MNANVNPESSRVGRDLRSVLVYVIYVKAGALGGGLVAVSGYAVERIANHFHGGKEIFLSPYFYLVVSAGILAGTLAGFLCARSMVSARRMASRLKAASERFHTFVADSPYGYYELDLDGRITCVNDRLCEITGCTREDLCGMSIMDFLRSGDVPRAERDLHLAVTEPNDGPRVYPVKIKGREKFFSINTLPMRNEAGIYGFFGTIEDVTEQVVLEKEIRESERKYRNIMENIIDVYYRADLEGKLTMVSPSGKELLGYGTVEEMIGKDIAETFYWDPADRKKLLTEIEKRGYVRNFEVKLRRKDGRPVFVQTNSHYVYDEGGEPIAIEGILRDVSEQKMIDNALRESEQRYRNLFEHSNDAIFIHTADGAIIDVNQRACDMLGYTYEELVDMNMVDIHPDREREKARRALAETRERGDTRFESVLRCKDGSYVEAEINAWAIDEKKGTMVGIVRDITARRRAEREQRELEARLRRARKMEALGALAGGVAHDLNNVLWGLVSYPDVVLSQLDEDSPLKDMILQIQRAGEKAASIVQDLLALARSGVVLTEVTNLNDIIREYLESVDFTDLKKQHGMIKWEVDLEEGIPNIVGSPVNIHKTVMNLVINGIEAMPHGGTMSISTRYVKIEEPIRGYEEIRPGEYALLRIRDEGEGIAEENLERIFEPFFTTKVMKQSGTGLGMAVVWATVKEHKGYIDVISRRGAGTEFRLYFPVTRKEKREEKEKGEVPLAQGEGERILIVDDQKDQLDLLATMLSHLGYSVRKALTGEEAVAYAGKENYDLVIVDMVLAPGDISGMETLRRIRRIHPLQKAIISSGLLDGTEISSEAEGPVAFLEKPYRLETLARAVREEIDR